MNARPESAEAFTHDRDCGCMGCCTKTATEAAQWLEEWKARPVSIQDQILAVEFAAGPDRELFWAAKTLRWIEANAERIKKLMKSDEAKAGKAAA